MLYLQKPTLSFMFLDIDECVNGENNCHNDYATCFNTKGNFTCSCNSGYRGDGVNCQGKKMPKLFPLKTSIVNMVVFQILVQFYLFRYRRMCNR